MLTVALADRQECLSYFQAAPPLTPVCGQSASGSYHPWNKYENPTASPAMSVM